MSFKVGDTVKVVYASMPYAYTPPYLLQYIGKTAKIVKSSGIVNYPYTTSVYELDLTDVYTFPEDMLELDYGTLTNPSSVTQAEIDKLVAAWGDISEKQSWGEPPKCECGAWKVKSKLHSTWCPMFGKE